LKRQQQKKVKEDFKILFFFFTSFLNGKTKKRGVFVFLFCPGERLGFQNKKLGVVGKPAREKQMF